MTSTEFLNKYGEQIESIASFARAVNFDFEKDDFNQLMKEWLERGRLFSQWVEENKADAIRGAKEAHKWL